LITSHLFLPFSDKIYLLYNTAGTGNIVEVNLDSTGKVVCGEDETSAAPTTKAVLLNRTPIKYRMSDGLCFPISNMTDLKAFDEKITFPKDHNLTTSAYIQDNRSRLVSDKGQCPLNQKLTKKNTKFCLRIKYMDSYMVEVSFFKFYEKIKRFRVKLLIAQFVEHKISYKMVYNRSWIFYYI